MVVTVVILLLIAGLFFGLLIVAIVCAINAKTTGGRVASIVTGVAILLLVPLAGVVLSLVTYRSASSQQNSVIESQRAPSIHQSQIDSERMIESIPAKSIATPPVIITPERPLPPIPNLPAGTWRSSDTETFQTNIYPSFEAAIKPMIKGLRETLVADNILARDGENQVIDPKKIVVTILGSSIESLVPQITENVRTQFPDAEVQDSGKVPPPQSADTLSIHLVVDNGFQRGAPWDREQQIDQGVLSCNSHFDTRTITFDCFVTQKPWVESFDRFVSTYPQRSFVVGYSGELQSSEGAARKAALADAARQATITIDGATYPIVDESHVIDRFAQQLSRSYGNVWREAVLVEVPDPDQVNVARNAAAVEIRRSAMGQWSQYFGIVFLIIAIVLICFLLNWITKGYYRGQVVLGLAGAVVVGFLFLVLLIS